MRKLALVLVLVAACKKAPEPEPQTAPEPTAAKAAAPVSVQEAEPNDFQRAQQIPARSVVSGTIAPAKAKAADDDWYRVPADGKTLALSVELKGDAALEVYDRDRNRLARTSDGFLPAVACVEACFVKVSGTVAGPYTLTVLGAAPAADAELEPNNRAVDATPLEPGKPRHGTIYATDDEDWYRVALAEVQPGQFLRVEVKGVEGVRPELEVRALEDGALLATMRAAAAGDSLLVRDLSLGLGRAAAAVVDAGTYEPPVAADADAAVEDGGSQQGAGSPDDAGAAAALADAGAAADTGAAAALADAGAAAAPAAPKSGGYLLVVKSAWQSAAKGKSFRGANARVPYTISATVETGPADLEAEPNDDLAHASPLGASATGYLAPAGDTDWYRIHLDAPMVAHVELSGADRADLELQVLAPGGDKPRLLARANEAGPREPEVIPSVGLPAGDSYVLVQGAARQLEGKWVRDAEDAQTPYKLTVALAADDGAVDREPNNDGATAQQAKLPLNATGFLWPRKDVDVYAFHVEAGHAPVSVRLPAVRGMDLMLRLLELHDGKADVIGTADQQHGEGDEQLLSVPLKEGDYAVEVSSPRNKDASATQQYQLSVQ